MKKTIITLLIGLLVVMLAACQSNSNNTSAQQTKTEAESTVNADKDQDKKQDKKQQEGREKKSTQTWNNTTDKKKEHHDTKANKSDDTAKTNHLPQNYKGKHYKLINVNTCEGIGSMQTRQPNTVVDIGHGKRQYWAYTRVSQVFTVSFSQPLILFL